MSFLDMLNAAADVPEAHFIKFLQQYKFRKKTLHFFFEGIDDQSFYTSFIEASFPEEYEFCYYVCNGKDNVYQIHDDIRWDKYCKNRVLFFVDKDLDDLIGRSRTSDENIFVTKYYSIENYLVKDSVYSRFLREICTITDSEVIEKQKAIFNQKLKEYYQHTLGLSAWILYCRKNRLSLNLDDFNIANIYSMDDSYNTKKIIPVGYKTRFHYICKATKTKHFSLGEIKTNIEKLKKVKEYKRYLRGKYELWFLSAFCKKTTEILIPTLNLEIKEHNKTSPNKGVKCKVSIQVKPDNIIQIMAPRVKMPNELSDFFSFHIHELAISS